MKLSELTVQKPRLKLSDVMGEDTSNVDFRAKKPMPQGELGALEQRERDVQSNISNRQNSIETLRKEVETPYDFKNKPVQSILKPLVTGVKTLAVPFSQAESGVATAALELQKGNINPINIGKKVIKGITGEKQAEIGDVFRVSGVSEPLAAGLGFASSLGLTNLATKGKLC